MNETDFIELLEKYIKEWKEKLIKLEKETIEKHPAH